MVRRETGTEVTITTVGDKPVTAFVPLPSRAPPRFVPVPLSPPSLAPASWHRRNSRIRSESKRDRTQVSTSNGRAAIVSLLVLSTVVPPPVAQADIHWQYDTGG